jgi:mono/diheme cytochrome c family protein
VRSKTAFAALAVAAVSAGCGTGAPSRVRGASLLAESCGTCHSLTGRQSPNRQGGDLLAFRMARGEMLEFVREMPVPHRLSSADQETVVDYVRSVEASAGR